jgi:hypothetical protein
MSYRKKIVCLANSKKPRGRCVAGKEVLQDGYGDWIRPVSARPSAEISLDERRYENGREPQILDIIEIPMIAAVPRVHQTENHMIDADLYWTKTGELPWEDLGDLVDMPTSLWRNGDSTYHGTNDRMTQAVTSEFRNSLWLIEPTGVTIRVLTPGAAFGNPKRCVRAEFTHQGIRYDLMVTDLVAEQAFLARPNGEYTLADAVYFCISITEAHIDGSCYKLWPRLLAKSFCEVGDAESAIHHRTFHPPARPLYRLAEDA